MMEIVFSESARGSLQAAQQYGKGPYRPSAIGVIVRPDEKNPSRKELAALRRKIEEQERLAWESAQPLGGSPADVFGFPLALSIGGLAEHERPQVLARLYETALGANGLQTAQETLQRAQEDLHTVFARMRAGERLRIWYSNLPDEICGLYWLLEQLDREKLHDGITLIRLSEWEEQHGNLLKFCGCGELAPGDWGRYLTLQVTAPPLFCRCCADEWRALCMQNSPLRALLNGRLAGMPETLYDHFILQEIAAEADTFQEAAVIARVISKYQLGIGDGWIALRIEEFVRRGLLEVVSAAKPNTPSYRRVLKSQAGHLLV